MNQLNIPVGISDFAEIRLDMMNILALPKRTSIRFWKMPERKVRWISSKNGTMDIILENLMCIVHGM